MTTDLYQQVTDQIITQLEAGVVPWLKPWTNGTRATPSTCNSLMPSNAVSRANYRGINVLLLWSAAQARGYTSNVWLTFKQANDLGGKVRAGQNAANECGATKIFFFRPLVKTTLNDAGDEEESKYLIMREYSVFNLEQCDGLKIESPKAALVSRDERDPRLAAFIASLGLKLSHGGDRAYYTTAGDYVQLPEYKAFTQPESYWATLFHETTHWTGHKSRCNREFGRRFGDNAYAAEELVAELGSAFLCAEQGVHGEIRHASYIDTWLRCLKADKRAIFTAASYASKAATFINERAASLP